MTHAFRFLARRRFLLAALFASSATRAEPPRILRLSALANGTLLADGKKVDIAALDRLFAALKADEGVVWYYREDAASQPRGPAAKVMPLILKHKLAVSLSSRSDFSDYVDAAGNSKPRP